MQIEEMKSYYKPETLEELRVMTLSPQDEEQVQQYLQTVAQRLIGDEWDFEQNPIWFTIVDNDNPNAAFVANHRYELDEYGLPKKEKIEIDTVPMVFVTKGLLEYVNSEDELAFILGHELGHFRQDALRGSHKNTKVEEVSSDYAALSMLADAGYSLSAARDLASRIFGGDDQNKSLQAIINSVLDAHPNNESRLNFIDVSIVEKTKNLRKKNIEASAIAATDINENIKEIAAKAHHRSFVENYLQAHQYAHASLGERQRIFTDCMQAAETAGYKRNDFGYPQFQYSINAPRMSDLRHEYVTLLSDLREELPQCLITQNDLELGKRYEYNKNMSPEVLQRLQELVETSGQKWTGQENLRYLFSKFPYKVVADENMETETAANELKKVKLQQQLADYSQPNLKLFETLFLYRRNYKEHPDLYELTSEMAGPALQNINKIPLSDSWPLGRKIKETAQGALQKGDFEDIQYLTALNYLIKNNDYNLKRKYDIENLPHIGSHVWHGFQETFQGVPLPSLNGGADDIGKKIPASWKNTDSLKDIFGAKKDISISDEEWVLEYSNPLEHNDGETSYYIINKDGEITAYYSQQNYEKLKAKIYQEARDDVFGHIVAKMRADKKRIEEFVKNPDIDKVSFDELEQMKKITMFSFAAFADEKNSPAAKLTSEYHLLLDRLYYSEELSYSKQKLEDLYSDTYYAYQSPYYAAKDLFLGEESIKEYLTPQEYEWFTKYNHAIDMQIFKAYQQKIEAASKIPGLGVKELARGSSLKDENYYSSLNNFFSQYSYYANSIFSKRQHTELAKTIFENYQLTPKLQYNDSNDGWWYRPLLVGQSTLQNIEMSNLAAYTVSQGGIEKADFDGYEPLYLKDLRCIIGYEPFTLEKSEQYLQMMEDARHKGDSCSHFRLEVMLYLLKNKSADFPLNKTSVTLLENMNFRDLMGLKLNIILNNEKNWPTDMVQATSLAKKLKDAQLVSDPAAVAETFINMLSREKDVKVLEAAVLNITSLFNDENIPVSRQNEIKDKLINNLQPLWQQPVNSQVMSFQMLLKANLFADNMVLQNKFLRSFIPQIEAQKDINKRLDVYHFMLLKENRIDDPDIRREYQAYWVENVFKEIGAMYDDNSEAYHHKIAEYVEQIKHETIEDIYGTIKRRDDFAMVDRLEILKMLADRVVSQQKLSEFIKPVPSGVDGMEAGNLMEGHMAGAAFDGIKLYLSYNPKNAEEIIDFLLSDGKHSQCETLSKKLIKYAEDRKNFNEYVAKEAQKNCQPEKLGLVYREFWQYPLEARAVLVNELLHSQVSRRGSGEKWERIFKIVADRVFPGSDETMNNIGKEFLHSYIKSRSDEEKTLYLSAMMVAANGNSATADPEKSIARGIRLFLENSGPAAIKLGQAMASYPAVPKFIRDEMQELKSNAARPSRWEIYEWLDFYKKENPQENLEFGKDVWLGRILGSASYFVTMEKGAFADGKIPESTDKVIKILRAAAELDSENEFKIFEKMLYDLGDKGVMEGGLDTFIRLVKQAKDSVAVETNLDIGRQQLETAKQIYPAAVEINGRSFNIHVADWPAYGKRWADLERAAGCDLDEIKDESYRRDFSKAYFTVEMVNMLSGGRFDHDRHGKQLKIDQKTNTIGLFDTGAMAVVDPAPKDKELLGRILYQTINEVLAAPKEEAFAKVGEVLSAKIEAVYASNQTDSPYLTEFQRGLLALSDFYKDFEAKDFIECFNSALNNSAVPVDKNIINGFTHEGISSIGLFDAKQNLLSYKDKENVGKLLFNVYAASLTDNNSDIKDIIIQEISKMEKTDIEAVPLLKVIKNGLKEGGNNAALQLPAQFIPALSEIIGAQDIDVGILKGMMKQSIKAVSLQEEKTAYPPEDRQNFGRMLYGAFASALEDKKKGGKVDLINSFMKEVKSSELKSSYAGQIYAVLNVAKQSGAAQLGKGGNLQEMMKAILLQGNMDKEVTKGITLALAERNPDSLSRKLMAKGVQYLLSQNTPEPGWVKKNLVRMFVKKKTSTREIGEKMLEMMNNTELNRGFVKALQGYVNKAAETLVAAKPVPQINLVTSKNTGKIA